MKTLALLVLAFALAMLAVAGSVIPKELTEQKCGNGKREGYELCEPETDFDLCPEIGKMLKIAMVCNQYTCGCLPDTKDCGNGIPEGAEMCESDKKGYNFDLCQNISNLVGLPLECDLQSCDCVAKGAPVVISYCGDNKVEGNEDCESDDDCPKGRTCNNCTCVREQQELNLTPVIYNVTTDEIAVPTIEEITERQKNAVLGFVLEDYVGEVLPEVLDYFDDETINIYVALDNGSNITISLVTTEMVVQEVHQYAMNDTTMEIWIKEDVVKQIKDSDERTETIVQLLTDGTIQYKPTGFFRRIWFYWFRPF